MNVEDNTCVRNEKIQKSKKTNKMTSKSVSRNMSKTILRTSISKIKNEGSTLIADNLL